MRVIHVGCGLISGRWLSAIRDHPNLELAALVDVDATAASAAAQAHDLEAPIFSSLDRALAEHTADVVFDCTPPPIHHGVTCTALAAGLHVFGEKPMADEMAQAREMTAAAHASGRTYAIMQNRQFDPNIRTLRRFIETGVIGELTAVNAEFYISPHFGGFRERMKNVLLRDMAIHTFDAARYLIGANAERVYCHEWNPNGSWFDHGASAAAIFEMNNDVVFTYLGSWCAEGLHTSWEAAWRIIGEKGSIAWDGGSTLKCQVVRGHGAFINDQVDVPVPDLIVSAPDTWHEVAIGNFVEIVSRGETPETVCDDNIHSLAMVIGAVESAEHGHRDATPPTEAKT